MKRILQWLRVKLCDHHVFIEQIERVSAVEVICPCNRCGKILHAPYGLALPATLERAT